MPLSKIRTTIEQSGQFEFRAVTVELETRQPRIIATLEHNGIDEYAANANVEWTRLSVSGTEEERHQIQLRAIFQQKGKGALFTLYTSIEMMEEI